MKTCCVCSVSKEATEFSPDKTKKDGLASLCKSCRRERYSTRYNKHYRNKRLMDTYGISSQDYEVLLDQQSGTCAICSSTETGRKDTWFCVDHDHETGQVRGLLCNNCNRALGLFKDNEQLLKIASDYVKSNRKNGSS